MRCCCIVLHTKMMRGKKVTQYSTPPSSLRLRNGSWNLQWILSNSEYVIFTAARNKTNIHEALLNKFPFLNTVSFITQYYKQYRKPTENPAYAVEHVFSKAKTNYFHSPQRDLEDSAKPTYFSGHAANTDCKSENSKLKRIKQWWMTTPQMLKFTRFRCSRNFRRHLTKIINISPRATKQYSAECKQY